MKKCCILAFSKFKNTNMCIVYGLGGMGMTTMFPNGLLLNEIVTNKYKTNDSMLHHIDYSSMLRYV